MNPMAAAAVLLAGPGLACGPQEEDWPGRKRAWELAGEKLPPPFEDLLRFCEREKLKDEAAFFQKALLAVRAAGK